MLTPVRIKLGIKLPFQFDTYTPFNYIWFFSFTTLISHHNSLT